MTSGNRPQANKNVSPEVRSQDEQFKKTQNDIDAGLDDISGMVANMKSMALDMGDELDGQNNRLDELDVNTTIEAERIKRATDKTRKMM